MQATKKINHKIPPLSDEKSRAFRSAHPCYLHGDYCAYYGFHVLMEREELPELLTMQPFHDIVIY